MYEESNLKGIKEFIPQGSLFGEGVVQGKGENKYRDRKAELWYFSFEKCKETWPKGTLTKAKFAIKTSHLKTEEDWSYLVSKCNQEEARIKGSWAKTFWSSLKVIHSYN